MNQAQVGSGALQGEVGAQSLANAAVSAILEAERASVLLLNAVLEKVKQRRLQSWHAALGGPDVHDRRRGVARIGARWYFCTDEAFRAEMDAADRAIQRIKETAKNVMPVGASLVCLSPDMDGQLIATLEIAHKPGGPGLSCEGWKRLDGSNSKTCVEMGFQAQGS